MVTTADLIAMKERAAADPARRRSFATTPTSPSSAATSPTPTKAGSYISNVLT